MCLFIFKITIIILLPVKNLNHGSSKTYIIRCEVTDTFVAKTSFYFYSL